MKNLIEVFIPYREMRRHIHELLNATIEDNVEKVTTELKGVEKVTIERKDVEKVITKLSDVEKATTGSKGKYATIELNDKENIIIQWKDALMQDLNFVGIVVRLQFHRLNSSLSFNPSPPLPISSC